MGRPAKVIDRALLEALFTQPRMSVVRAAPLLGVNRNTLLRRLGKDPEAKAAMERGKRARGLSRESADVRREIEKLDEKIAALRTRREELLKLLPDG